jgi:hypothetical protein
LRSQFRFFIGFFSARAAIRLWRKQWEFSRLNKGVTVIRGQVTDHHILREHPTFSVPYPQPKYYIKCRYTYNGTTYAKWLEVSMKYYQAWYNGCSIDVRCLSNQPEQAYLPEYNEIRRHASYPTIIAVMSLVILVIFVPGFIVPHFSEIVNGDNPKPTPTPFGFVAPPTISIRPTVTCERSFCTAQQIADEYCIELINKGVASPSLYLTPVPSYNTPTGAIVSDCSHEQLYCPTSDTAYANVFVTYYYDNKYAPFYGFASVLLNLQHENAGWKISSDRVTTQFQPPLPGQECQT